MAEAPVVAEGEEIDAELVRKLEEFRRERFGDGRRIAPLRTCVGCRNRFAQNDLVRFVRGVAGWHADTGSRRKQTRSRRATFARRHAPSTPGRIGATRGLARRRQNMV